MGQQLPFKGRVIIVDDDQEMRSLLQDFFGSTGFRTYVYPTATDALKALGPNGECASSKVDGDIDLIISDINMPGMTGLEFTSEIQKIRPEIPILLITAFGSIETAVDAMRRGAFHYVIKPFKLTEMSIHVDRALEYRKLQRDNSVLREEVKRPWLRGGMIGKSQAIHDIFEMVQKVSKVSANVLITGESGTGKEIVARMIHESGPRRGQPFVAINCSAIPENLLESELFGHAKGSFTGAIQRKLGLFEEARGGTLFLDEIGDLAVQLQAKLLRVLQEKKVRAVGDNISKDVDVRIISATHKDLKAAIKEGRFREDLYYRMGVIPIVIPPLRHRREDIPLLAEHFLKKFSATNNVKVTGFTKRAMKYLTDLSWEGNVRELENIVERAVVLSAHALIDEPDLRQTEQRNTEQFFGEAVSDSPTLEQLELRYIKLILQRTGGRKDQAAQILGINRRTLYRKEREFGLVDPQTSDEDLDKALEHANDEKEA